MDRFFKKIDIKTPDKCWNWVGCINSNGYGVFHVNGKNRGAHRVSWEIHKGNIPNNLFVCHKCDNPKCVNPNHLFLGTNSDNMKDASYKGRLKNTYQFGSKPPNRLLTDDEATKIKNEIINRNISLKRLSEKLNIPYQLIRDISCGRVYKNCTA